MLCQRIDRDLQRSPTSPDLSLALAVQRLPQSNPNQSYPQICRQSPTWDWVQGQGRAWFGLRKLYLCPEVGFCFHTGTFFSR